MCQRWYWPGVQGTVWRSHRRTATRIRCTQPICAKSCKVLHRSLIYTRKFCSIQKVVIPWSRKSRKSPRRKWFWRLFGYIKDPTAGLSKTCLTLPSHSLSSPTSWNVIKLLYRNSIGTDTDSIVQRRIPSRARVVTDPIVANQGYARRQWSSLRRKQISTATATTDLFQIRRKLAYGLVFYTFEVFEIYTLSVQESAMSALRITIKWDLEISIIESALPMYFFCLLEI